MVISLWSHYPQIFFAKSLLSSIFQTIFLKREKMENSDLAHFVEDGTEVKIPSKTKPPLF